MSKVIQSDDFRHLRHLRHLRVSKVCCQSSSAGSRALGNTPWEILGVAPGASPAEIKKAYRRKALTPGGCWRWIMLWDLGMVGLLMLVAWEYVEKNPSETCLFACVLLMTGTYWDISGAAFGHLFGRLQITKNWERCNFYLQ